jgi:hypothetical protein
MKPFIPFFLLVIIVLVEEFCREPDDGSEPNRWDAIPSVA